ncbi:hypothetical protein EDC04DRAFT_2830353 [Pisolithus marmoratus]|nr:hypothetical protein EDC04DRAFT_2830353 [Pisolithus marmoratus]
MIACKLFLPGLLTIVGYNFGCGNPWLRVLPLTSSIVVAQQGTHSVWNCHQDQFRGGKKHEMTTTTTTLMISATAIQTTSNQHRPPSLRY